MIDLEALVHKTLDLETRYYDLLSTHQELVHAYETLKEDFKDSFKDGYDSGWGLGYSEGYYADRTGPGINNGPQDHMACEDDQSRHRGS